jgi:hypothetical protein
VSIACSCHRERVATFYADHLLNGGHAASLYEYLLADIAGSSLEDQLVGLITKTEAMAILRSC